MNRFIKVADDSGACDFINLDLVVKVSCSVVRTKKGGGFNIESITDSTVPASSPVTESTMAVITLLTASEGGEIRFSNLHDATEWAQENLGIAVPFDQL
jgi:hypothetical protein